MNHTQMGLFKHCVTKSGYNKEDVRGKHDVINLVGAQHHIANAVNVIPDTDS